MSVKRLLMGFIINISIFAVSCSAKKEKVPKEALRGSVVINKNLQPFNVGSNKNSTTNKAK